MVQNKDIFLVTRVNLLPFLDVYVLPKGDFTVLGLSLYIIMLSFEKKGSAIVTKNMEIRKVY